MIFGPVLRAELLTTARRKRYYATRLILGALMLWMLSVSPIGCYRGDSAYGYADIRVMANQARSAAQGLSVLLVWAVLLLTPALTAGVIAEEKQRKTLLYLLASQLGSAEIVLDKLAARLLHVLVLLASALPIQALLALFGGISPEHYLTFFLSAMATALTLASLSICVSVHVKRPRDALIASYMLAQFWAIAPVMLRGSLTSPPLSWMIDLLRISSPGYILELIDFDRPDLWLTAFVHAGAQIMVSAALLAWAILRLRPVASRQLGGGDSRSDRPALPPLPLSLPAPASALNSDAAKPDAIEAEIAAALAPQTTQDRKPSRFAIPRMPVPRCGGDPMLWKELFFSRPGCLIRFVGGLFMASIVYALCAILFNLYSHNYYYSSSDYSYRYLNEALRIFTAFVYGFIGLAVAARAASGISGEREADTWISLTTTTLSGAEIIRAKILGAVFGLRWPLGVLLLGWALGVLLGGVHPIGLVWCLILLTVYLGFAAGLGTLVSLKSPSSLRAQGLTIAILVVLNGGYLLCCVPLANGWGEGFIVMTAGVTPAHLAFGLASYDDIGTMLARTKLSGPGEAAALFVVTGIISLMAYSAGSWFLITSAISELNVRAHRPWMSPSGQTQRLTAASSEGIRFLDDANRKQGQSQDHGKPTDADKDLDLI